MKKVIQLVFVFYFQVWFVLGTEFKRICYYTNWSQYRDERGYGFYPEDVNPSLCTHIIYAFGKIDGNTITNFETNDVSIGDLPGMYSRMMSHKKTNSNIKIMLAIGGWNAGTEPFEQITKSKENMVTFAKNSLSFLRKWDFDGLAIHWQYPIDKKRDFSLFLETLKGEFQNEMTPIGKSKLLLTAAVGVSKSVIDSSYEINRLNELLDFVNIMAYDYHGSWDPTTGFHTALYSRNNENEWEKRLNVDWTVNYWLSNGMAREKLILGLAFYGRGFSLNNTALNAPGSGCKGPSTAGRITLESGFLAYHEICSYVSSGAVLGWNDEQMVPSLQVGNDWIGYENEKSITVKVQYALSKCLGGVMMWALDLDDFKGKYCDRAYYPLLNAVVTAIGDGTCRNETLVTQTRRESASYINKTLKRRMIKQNK